MNKVSLTINDLFDVPTSRIYNPHMLNNISAVTIDSRHVPARSLFVAIKGDKFDGHSFIHDAVHNGASAILIKNSKYKNFHNLDIPVIAVEDTILAFGFLASVWRNKLNTRIIGITGSAGKTSVKEMLAVLLNEKYHVNRTIANNNNHIGVPLTLFSTTNKHDYLVLELGTNHFGEIAYTAEIAKPDFALITNIGSSHLEFLKNSRGVLKEKAALLKSTAKNNGTLIINSDDKYLRNFYSEYPKRVTYSLESKADFSGSIERYTEDGKAVLKLSDTKGTFSVELPVWGDQAPKNFMAAAAVASIAGLSKRQIIAGASKIKIYDKRFVVKKYKDTVIIDDTYNANPDSMKNAIVTLQRIFPGKEKIAVLGDMLELGIDSPVYHSNLAKVIKKAKLDRVYTIGSMSMNIYESLKTGSAEARHFISRASLKRFLQRQKFDNAVILFKGSRGMKMEEFLKVTEEKYID